MNGGGKNGSAVRPDAVLCERDGERTLLTCAQCATPICPRCLVRTPVGMKCVTCSGQGGRSRRRRGRWAWLARVGLAVAVVAAFVVPRVLMDSHLDRTIEDPGAPASGTVVPLALPARMGQPARDGDLVLVVSAFECGATAAGPRVAQGRFCFLTVTVRNAGQVPTVFAEAAQILADPLARRFGPDPSATAAHPANAGRDLGMLVVNPGNEAQGVYVFDVPPDVTPVTAALRAGPTTPGALVSLTARA